MAARLGPVGVWSGELATVNATEARAAAATVEGLGYGSLWIGETPRWGREAFSSAAMLLAATEQVLLATGIANIWLREPATAAAAAGTLAEAYPGRFVLGLGASHASALSLVGKDYGKPLTALRNYLDAIERDSYLGPQPAEPGPVILAALRRGMQELARDRSDGMHSFFVPPRHTAAARAFLGPLPLLVPEQAVVINADADVARRRARRHVASRLALPNYVAHLRALGYTDQDMANDGSDALVDELVAWGNPDSIAARIQQHLDAGADSVAIHALGNREDPLGLSTLRELAGCLPLATSGRDQPTATPDQPTDGATDDRLAQTADLTDI